MAMSSDLKAINTLNIGVSSCLLGNAVRYDGKHKYNKVLANELGRRFNLIPFCPEVAIGMTIPRPPIQLVSMNNELHAVDREYGVPDYTQQLKQQANKYLADSLSICGYIFQEKSPSCGYQSSKVHDTSGILLHHKGSGIFAAAIRDALPDLPIIESQDLEDPNRIERFILMARQYAENNDL